MNTEVQVRWLSFARPLCAAAMLAAAIIGQSCGDDDSGKNNKSDAATDAATKLSDAQIAGYMHAANQGEIMQGQLATSKGSDQKVKDFGQHMIDEHTAADARLLALATPADSAQSQALTAKSNQIVADLNTKMGGDFDKAYMDAQIEVHTTVLKMLDETLLKDVMSSALKTELQSVRSDVAEHLADATTTRGELEVD